MSRSVVPWLEAARRLEEERRKTATLLDHLHASKQERRQPAEAAKVDGRQRDARMEEILAGLNVLLERNGEGGADSSKSTGRQRKGRDAQS